MSKKQILLHVCCGPCALVPVRRLRAHGFNVTGLFANPNIHPLSEYLKRRETMSQCANELDLPMLWRDDVWDIQQFTFDVSNLQNKERERCTYCYTARLDICAKMSNEHGFDAFCTSLLYSRYQNHEKIIETSQAVSQKYNAKFYYEDFRNEWQKGIDVSKELKFYRQNYCGCIYSESERHAKKLKKLLEHNALQKNI